MGFWNTLANEFSNGVAAKSREMPVNRLCRDIGWDIDEQNGKYTSLYFKGDHVRPQREVTISHAEGETLATIMCACPARFTSGSLPADLPLTLLGRSQETIGGWYAVFDEDDDTVRFVCGLAVQIGTIESTLFKSICMSLLSEVAEVERNLSRLDLL
jgi:hypothetical protein